MKIRIIPVIAAVLLILCASALAADESEFFFKSIPITKVYSHRDGYRVVYRRSNMELAVLYLPDNWFQFTPGEGQRGKAELVMANDPSYPYMSIFWKDGAFDHIRLYLKPDKNDFSWGNLDNPEEYNDKFNAETLDTILF